jgi:hypothetical protein
MAFHDTQSSVTVGALIFGEYQFRVAEEDTRDITMKRFEINDSRLNSWIRSHPEKNKSAHNFDEMAKGMFMADAEAALEHETVKTLVSTRLPMVQIET